MEVRHRDFRRRDQIEIVSLQMVGIVAELGKLSGPLHRFRLHDVWRGDLCVSVLADVEVEHEGDERAGERGALTDERLEARPGDLGPSLEVDDSQILADLPVRPRRKREGPCVAPSPHLDVLGGVGANGDARVRDVGDLQQQGLQLAVDPANFGLQHGDPLGERPRLGDELSPLLRVLRARDLR